MARYYFFVTKLELLPLLKREVKSRFPHLIFSFAFQNILFFKNSSEKNQTKIYPALCSLHGPMFGKCPIDSPSDLDKLLSDVGGPSFCEMFFYNHKDLKLSFHENLLSEQILFAVEIKEILYIGSFHKELKSLLNQNFEVSPFELEESAPSRAYLKALEYLQILRERGENFSPGLEVIEIGCAPGGASWALCELGAKVFGVDPGLVSTAMERFSNHFFHSKISMQQLSIKDWRRYLSNPQLLVCDVNLRPSEIIIYLKNILSDFKSNGGKYLIWTVKLTDWRNCEQFFSTDWPMIEREIEKFSPKYKLLRVVPTHHKEFLYLVEF